MKISPESNSQFCSRIKRLIVRLCEASYLPLDMIQHIPKEKFDWVSKAPSSNGAHGEVYKARMLMDDNSSQLVAVKRLRKNTGGRRSRNSIARVCR